MTIDEVIKNEEKLAELNEDQAQIYREQDEILGSWSHEECANNRRQLAEWLRELKELRDFANFVAESVMEEDFKENSDFYAEVFCRKLHKIGFIQAEDNKWIFNNEGVKPNADSD